MPNTKMQPKKKRNLTIWCTAIIICKNAHQHLEGKTLGEMAHTSDNIVCTQA